MKYVGYIVSVDGISLDLEKVKKVRDWPQTKDFGKAYSFLGLENYFRKFVQGYSKMAAPLTDLEVVVGKRWEWMGQCAKAFEEVKRYLTRAPFLRILGFDEPFEVVADASKLASGAMLLQ